MIVSILGYQNTIGDNDSDELITMSLESAQQKVEDEVGYSLEASDYTEEFIYYGSYTFNLGHFKINTIDGITVNGIELQSTDYVLSGHLLTINKTVSLYEGTEIVISYNAGWTPDALAVAGNCPSSIRYAIMLIAQALSKNIGAAGYSASASFGDNSMTFDQTRYYKFYDLIQGFKVVKF